MSNWISRWFDKPKGKTVLRSPTAATPSVASPTQASGGAEWVPGDVVLDEYRVVRELGRGSMGTVYLVANPKSPELKFAVKRIRVAGDIYRRHFLAELQTWIDLQEHPNLVACRFFRTVGDELVIFAEYVEGATLAQWIADKKLTRIETMLDFAIQFAWGLHAAHEQGVIHQDVKPSNALITADGTVKVADFGLARAQPVAMQRPDGDSHQTILVAHAGGMTDEYCSPEQAQGQPLSRRSDLWSWGVSVLEMFTGKVTWRSGVLAAVALEDFLKAQASGNSRIEGQPPMPQSVAAVLGRCFRDDPEERWPTLLEAAQAMVDAYREVCGATYPRRAPAAFWRDRGAVVDLDRRLAGSSWSDPKTWLVEALRAAGRDPAEADTLAHSTRHAHNLKAQAVGDVGTYQEAQTIFERLVVAGRSELRERLADLSLGQALAHRFVGDEPGALRAYSRAIATYESLVDQEGRRELSNDLATAYMNKALSISALGDNQAAVDLHGRAIKIRERLVEQEGRRELSDGLAMAYMNKAISVSNLGDNRAAVDLYDRAIKIVERLVEQEGRRELSDHLALAYMNKATAFFELGDKRAAVDLYGRAIEIQERLVEQEGRRERFEYLAIAYMNNAHSISDLGDKQVAVVLYDRAIAVFERLVDQEGRHELSYLLARAYGNKANSVSDLGDNQAAADLYDRAIEIRERLVDQEGRRELAGDLATVQAYQAHTLNKLGNRTRAVALARSAVVTLESEVKRTGSAHLRSVLQWAQQNIGELL